MLVYFQILNISTLNSYILYNCFKDIEIIERFEFSEKFSLQLVKDYLRDRLRGNFPRDLRDVMTNLLGGNSLIPVNAQPIPSTSRFSLATPDSAEVNLSPTPPLSDQTAKMHRLSVQEKPRNQLHTCEIQCFNLPRVLQKNFCTMLLEGIN